MRLGQFISELEDAKPDIPVYIAPFNLIPTSFHSYRGYYEDLALGYETGYKRVTAGELCAVAKAAIGNSFLGWKGGEYTVDGMTRVWISNPGEVTGAIVSRIVAEDWAVYIHVDDFP